jgi:hypothetical protein
MEFAPDDGFSRKRAGVQCRCARGLKSTERAMKTWKTLQLMGVAAVAGMLAACPGDRDDRAEPATDVPVTEVGPGMQTPADTLQAMPLPERVALQDQGAGVTAEAVVSPMDGATHVVIEVRQAPANTGLQGSLLTGQCGSPGAQVASLGTVTTDAAGTGRGEAHLNIPGHTVLNGQHHIRLTAGAQATPAQPAGAAATPGAAGACADLPAREIPHTQPGAQQQPATRP